MVIECDINKLHEVGLNPTLYGYLYYIFKDLDYPFKNVIPPNKIEELSQNGWINIDADSIVTVREKFKEFINERETTKNVETWIVEYCELFPVGIYNNATPVRSSKTNCLKKMKTFVNENKKITKEDIIEATKLYLEKRGRDGYKYTMSAQNFISKDGISMLLNIIEDVQARVEYRENIIKNREDGGSAFHKQI